MSTDGQYSTLYAMTMSEGRDHLILTIDTKDPIEIGAFVGQFTSVASQYEKFIREIHPDLNEESQVFVSEVKEGSIIAILIPAIGSGLFFAGKAIEHMDKILIVDEFVRRYGGKLASYFGKGGREREATKGDLRDFHNAVAAIANDPNASARLEAAHFEDGIKQIRASFTFSTPQARIAEQEIQSHRLELEHSTSADHERVLMVFTRSDVQSADLHKRSGERATIESISPKPRPLIFASQITEERIRHEIRDEEDDNVFKKGFVVDVNVELRHGMPIAYRITNLHDIIDLPDD